MESSSINLGVGCMLLILCPSVHGSSLPSAVDGDMSARDVRSFGKANRGGFTTWIESVFDKSTSFGDARVKVTRQGQVLVAFTATEREAMAANYWSSTQHKFWLFTPKELAEKREALEDSNQSLVQSYPLPDRRHLSIFFQQQLMKIGRRIGVRQQALATAQIYIRRLYVQNEIRHTNPYLVVATALYLACKMEECPHHIRIIVSEARNLWPDFILSDVSKLGECEFFLISEMSCQLIVHHPYRTLTSLQKTFNMSQDEVSLAWSIVNDTYLSDIPLLYSLHVIAVTAIFLALVLKPTQAGLQAAAVTASSLASAVQAARGTPPLDGNLSTPQGKVQYLVKWLAESEIDIKSMIEATQEIISLYEVWEQYSDKTCKEQISRFVKARSLDK